MSAFCSDSIYPERPKTCRQSPNRAANGVAITTNMSAVRGRDRAPRKPTSVQGSQQHGFGLPPRHARQLSLRRSAADRPYRALRWPAGHSRPPSEPASPTANGAGLHAIQQRTLARKLNDEGVRKSRLKPINAIYGRERASPP
jgi:hypothetical protein